MTKTIDEIFEAIERNHPPVAHPGATKVIVDAIQELAALRTQVQALIAERDELRIACDGLMVAANVACDKEVTRAVTAEREACAKVCEEMVIVGCAWTSEQGIAAQALFAAAENIRARGKL